jgi:hypothetical protein
MEKCIVDLFSSVTQIDRRYFNAIGTRQNGTQYPQVIENSFTAELYHRFKSISELTINCAYYDNLILHFDISKYAGDLRPDLVLHQAQENRLNQKMYIEVKTDCDANLANDFDKLLYAIRDLEFKNAVMVLVNRPFASSKEIVSNAFRHLEFNEKEKLFLINIEILVNNSIDYNLFSFTSIRKVH